jgi:hypothetical protein
LFHKPLPATTEQIHSQQLFDTEVKLVTSYNSYFIFRSFLELLSICYRASSRSTSSSSPREIRPSSRLWCSGCSTRTM